MSLCSSLSSSLSSSLLARPLLLAAGLAACGDDTDPPGAQVDAAPIDAAPARTRAVVVTPSANFAAGEPGVLSVVDLETLEVQPNVGPAMAISSDPVLRRHGDLLYVVNRSANNVTILDAGDLSLVEQLGTGAGTNPQDVAVIGDTLLVPTFGNAGAVVVRRGGGAPQVVDLSADDPDGKPNCNSVVRVGSDFFVACGLLDDTQQFLPPRGPGRIYVVNGASLTVTRTITLMNRNPINLMEQLPPGAPNAGDLLVSSIEFATGAGCVERVTTGAAPASAGCVVTNAALGNYASRIGVHAPTEAGAPQVLWAAVPTLDFSGAALRAYDLAGTLWPEPVSAPGQVIGDLAVCPDGDVVVSDAPFMGAGGLRVFRGATERTTAALPVGLKPASSAGLVCY